MSVRMSVDARLSRGRGREAVDQEMVRRGGGRGEGGETVVGGGAPASVAVAVAAVVAGVAAGVL